MGDAELPKWKSGSCDKEKGEEVLGMSKLEQPRGINWEIGINIYTLLYIEQITNKNLPYSTGNSTQYSVMTYMEKESRKEWMYVYV